MASRLRWSAVAPLLACVILGCPPQSSTSPPGSREVTLTNGDAENDPWVFVAEQIEELPYQQLQPTNHSYTLDLTKVKDTAEVKVVIVRQPPNRGPYMNVFDQPASFFIQHNATDYTGAIGGIATDTATGSGTLSPGQQQQIVAGRRGATIYTAPNNSFSLGGVFVGAPTGVRTAIGPVGGLPTGFNYKSATLTPKQDISSYLAPTLSLRQAVANVLGITLPRHIVTGTIFDYAYDDVDEDDNGSSCDDDEYARLEVEVQYNVPVPNPSDLPSNTLQSLRWVGFPTPESFLETRTFFRDQTNFAPQLAPAYQPPTISVEPAPYQAFRINGTLASPYSGFRASYWSNVGGQLYTIDMSYGFGKKTFDLTTPTDPIFQNYAPPSGSSGTFHFTALSYDPFAAPKAGDTRFKGGLTQYFGNVMKPSLTIAPTTGVTGQPGQTVQIPVQVTRSNFAGSVFIAPVTVDPHLTLSGTTIGPGQENGVLQALISSSATPGQYASSMMGDAFSRGLEMPYPFPVQVNVQSTSSKPFTLSLTPSSQTLKEGLAPYYRNYRVAVHITRNGTFTGAVFFDAGIFAPSGILVMEPSTFQIPAGQSDSAIIINSSGALPGVYTMTSIAHATVGTGTAFDSVQSVVAIDPWPATTFAVTITLRNQGDTVGDKVFQMTKVTEIVLTPNPDSSAANAYHATGSPSPPWVTIGGIMNFPDSLDEQFGGAANITAQGHPTQIEFATNISSGVLQGGVLNITYPFPTGATIGYLVNGTQTSQASGRIAATRAPRSLLVPASLPAASARARARAP